MSDWLHRVVSGTPVTSKQLVLAGTFAIVWFLMDFVQWLDWLHGYLYPVTSCTMKVP